MLWLYVSIPSIHLKLPEPSVQTLSLVCSFESTDQLPSWFLLKIAFASNLTSFCKLESINHSSPPTFVWYIITPLLGVALSSNLLDGSVSSKIYCIVTICGNNNNNYWSTNDCYRKFSLHWFLFYLLMKWPLLITASIFIVLLISSTGLSESIIISACFPGSIVLN